MPRLIVVAGLLALSACKGQEGPNEKDVMAQADKLVKPLPGLYRSTTALTSFELPGAPPQTADMMRDRFSRVLPQTREFCITPEAAGRGFADMVRQTQQGDCTIDDFAADNTYLRARMTCRSAGGVSSTVRVQGTGEPDRSHIALEIVQAGASIPGGSETISMTVDNQRTGDCPR